MPPCLSKRDTSAEIYPMELLLSFPLLWRTSKILRFLLKCHNFLKHKKGKPFKIFRTKLNRDAMCFNIWPSDATWETILGPKDSQILGSFKGKRKKKPFTYKSTKLLVPLLRLIRNKYDHKNEMSLEDLQSLNWVSLKDGEWKFDEKLFVEYWINKFPRLAPFLWSQFKTFQKDFQAFYPVSLKEYFGRQDLYFMSKNLDSHLDQSLTTFLEQGKVDQRFLMERKNNPDSTMEFSTIGAKCVRRLLGKRSAAEVKITDDEICCKWFLTANGSAKVVDKRVIKLRSLGRHARPKLFLGRLLISERVCDLFGKRDLGSVKGFKNVVLTNSQYDEKERNAEGKILTENFANLLSATVTNRPVQWNELKNSTKQFVINNGSFLMMGEKVEIRDLLGDDKKLANDLLSHLEGEEVNKLLKEGQLEILNSHTNPKKLHYYIPRQLSKLGQENNNEIDESAFVEHCTSDVNNGSLTFITDKPGAGKSELLKSMAQSTLNNYPRKKVIPLHFKMSNFAEEITKTCKQGKVKKQDVINAILNLASSGPFDTALLQKLFGLESSPLKVQLMLDGLDELHSAIRKTAICALKIAETEFPNVTTVVTVRDNMHADIQSKFPCSSVHRLVPFKEQELISIMKSIWTDHWKISGRRGDKPNSENLNDFAKTCLKAQCFLESSIVATPLQCRLIAEVFQDRVLEGTFKNNLSSEISAMRLSELYKKVMEKKLDQFLVTNSERREHDPSSLITRVQAHELHEQAALQTLFPDSSIGQVDIQSPNFHSSMQLIKLIRVKAVHSTFAEYIVANFIHNVVNNKHKTVKPNNDSFLTLFNNMIERVDCNRYWQLKSCYQLQFPTLEYFLNAIASKQHYNEAMEKSVGYLNELLESDDFDCFLDKSLPLVESFLETKSEVDNLLTLLTNHPQHIEQFLVFLIGNRFYDLCKSLLEQTLDVNDILKPFSKPNAKLPFLKINEDKNRYGILHWVVLGICHYCSGTNSSENENEKKLKWQDEIDNMKDFVRFIVSLDENLLEQRDAHGRTPLLLLLKGDCPYDDENNFHVIYEMVSFFVLELGASVNVTDICDNSVLHVTHNCPRRTHCCDEKYLIKMHINLLNIFMKKGCNEFTINSYNSTGETPVTSLIKRFTTAKLVFSALRAYRDVGADLNLKQWDGKTLIEIASERELGDTFINELTSLGVNYSENCTTYSVLHSKKWAYSRVSIPFKVRRTN